MLVKWYAIFGVSGYAGIVLVQRLGIDSYYSPVSCYLPVSC